MAAKALTQLAIDKARPRSERCEIPDGKAPGLYLTVQPSGKKSWAFRYRHKGLSRKLTIGPYPEISLGEARTLASEARIKVARGGDPAANKRVAREAALDERRAEQDKIESVAERYVERHAKPNNRTWKETERLLKKHIAAAWRDRRLGDIKRRDVHDLLDGIVAEGKPSLANAVFSTFRGLCSWAVQRDIIPTSPCQGVKAPTAKPERERVLNDDEFRLIWNACDRLGWPYGPITKLLAITGQRLSEVSKARWDEFDLEAGIWVLPSYRVKNGVEHTVPLSETAVHILKSLPRIASDEDLVFTGDGKSPPGGFNRAKRRFDELAPLPHPWVFHDLRRTVASGMARLGQPVHVVEAVLNHRSGAIRGVARVYNRHDYAAEKRAALEAWSRHVEKLLADQPADNVIEFATATSPAVS
jgi:integrase